MSRYYFHIRDGRYLVPDEEGMECRDIVAVHDEARASARDLANAALQSSYGILPATIEIEDEDGTPLGMMTSKFSIN